MKYFYQDGPATTRDEFSLSVDGEISYEGLWHSLNDHFNFRLFTEGFNKYDQTYRRQTVSSQFYAGDYQVRAVKENRKFAWQVACYGENQTELEENIDAVIAWFTQDSFNVRTAKNEILETFLADTADYTVDGSHIYLHNCMAICTFNFQVSPVSIKETVL